MIFNIMKNHWWAGGNIFLVTNTVLLSIQSFNAFWLIFEFPIYLKFFKLIRTLSLEFAVVFSIVYIGMLTKFIKSVFYWDEAT